MNTPLYDLIEENWASCNSLVRFKELMEQAYEMGYDDAEGKWRDD
jgi:hypothetical protein